MSAAKARRGLNRLAHEDACARDCVPEAHLLGEARSRGRGERATSAMRMLGPYARIGETLEAAAVPQQVDDRVALEVATLQQHAFSPQRCQPLDSTTHVGLA